MKTVNTLLGTVATITGAQMVKKAGYGQYNVEVFIEYNGAKETIRIHSTNSRMYDKVMDMDTQAERSEYLLKKCEYVIEMAIENHFN